MEGPQTEGQFIDESLRQRCIIYFGVSIGQKLSFVGARPPRQLEAVNVEAEAKSVELLLAREHVGGQDLWRAGEELVGFRH